MSHQSFFMNADIAIFSIILLYHIFTRGYIGFFLWYRQIPHYHLLVLYEFIKFRCYVMCYAKYELRTKVKSCFTSYSNTILLSHFIVINTKAMSSRSWCKVNPDLFCYMCDVFTSMNNRKYINHFVSKAYDASFWLIRKNRVHHIWMTKTVRRTYFSGLGVLELHFSLAFWLFGVSHKITSTADTSAWLTSPTLTRRIENLWNILLSIQLYRSESY